MLPGHLIQRIDPAALEHLASNLARGSVVISGTNGKTTTARMVARVAAAAGLRPVHNRAGANLLTGVTSALAAQADLLGRSSGDIGIFEIDEAHVPSAVRILRPRVVVFTNVFRDQLDRYGEIDLIADVWRSALQTLDNHATLVLNADDPIVFPLAELARGPVITFGVEDESLGGSALPHDADRRLCPACSGPLAYTRSYYGHLGHYRCPACAWGRQAPSFALRSAAPDGGFLQHLVIDTPAGAIALDLPLAGLYNAYNALAATAVASALDIGHEAVRDALSGFTGVFGRQERIDVGAGSLSLTLVKNPVGFNQALATEMALGAQRMAARTVGPSPNAASLMVIAISDRFADGTDVSWLWDVDFEVLASGAHADAGPSAAGPWTPRRVLCTGLRAHDMALRLKYALFDVERIAVEPAIGPAVAEGLRVAEAGGSVSVLATYTPMLEIRERLERLHYVAPFWDD